VRRKLPLRHCSAVMFTVCFLPGTAAMEADFSRDRKWGRLRDIYGRNTGAKQVGWNCIANPHPTRASASLAPEIGGLVERCRGLLALAIRQLRVIRSRLMSQRAFSTIGRLFVPVILTTHSPRLMPHDVACFTGIFG
jgi:hypothetical protein